MQTTATRLLVKPAVKLESPMDTIFMTRFFLSRMVETLSFKIALSPVRNFKIHAADRNWEITVARAAPWTSMLKTKIKIGSRMMLVTAPRSTVIMPTFPKPWELTKAFIPRPVITKTLPRR